MSDTNAREAEMDNLLRRSMAAAVPHLSPDFHQVLARELRRRSETPNRFGRILLANYVGVSVVVSVIVMRGQGLGWVPITVMMIAPLATLELARRLRRWPMRIRL
jgi:anti-sigma factor RsiW